jgi:hypothetical protein
VLPTGELLDWPEETALDLIDDELFATDYRLPSQRRHLTVLPEPPTVRFFHQPVVTTASPYTSDENGVEIFALIGLAVLLIVGVAVTSVILVWWF